jgi:hypothetical protein
MSRRRGRSCVVVQSCAVIQPLERRTLLSVASGVIDRTLGVDGYVRGTIDVRQGDAHMSGWYRGVAPLVYRDGSVAMLFPNTNTQENGGSNHYFNPPTVLTKFNRNGGFDRSFGNRGSVEVNTWFSIWRQYLAGNRGVFDYDVDSQNRVYLATQLEDQPIFQRINRNGSVDVAFSTMVASVLGPGDVFTEVAVDAQGRMLACLDDYNPATGRSQPRLVRFNLDGSRDGRFAISGSASIDGGFTDLLPTRDGGVLVTSIGLGDVTVRKFNASGQVDQRFGTLGVWRTSIGWIGRELDSVTVIEMQAGGFAVAFGDQGWLWRLDASGRPVASFGSAGAVSLPGSVRVPWAIRANADGSLLVARSTHFANGNSSNADTELRLHHVSPSGIITNGSADLRTSTHFPISSIGAPAFRPDGSIVMPAYAKDQADAPVSIGFIALRPDLTIDRSYQPPPVSTTAEQVLVVRADGTTVMQFTQLGQRYVGPAARGPSGQWQPVDAASLIPVAFAGGRKGIVTTVGAFSDTTDGDGYFDYGMINQRGQFTFIGQAENPRDNRSEFMPLGYVFAASQASWGPSFTSFVYPDGTKITSTYFNDTLIRIVPDRLPGSTGVYSIYYTDYETPEVIEGVEDWRIWFPDSTGNIVYYSNNQKQLRKLTPDRLIDRSFTPIWAQGWNLDMDSRDRILTWRILQGTGIADGDVQVKRYLPNGQVDRSFGNNGLATIDMRLRADAWVDVYIDDRDRIVLTATEQTGSRQRFSMVRLTSDPSAATTVAPVPAIGHVSAIAPVATVASTARKKRAGTFAAVEVV